MQFFYYYLLFFSKEATREGLWSSGTTEIIEDNSDIHEDADERQEIPDFNDFEDFDEEPTTSGLQPLNTSTLASSTSAASTSATSTSPTSKSTASTSNVTTPDAKAKNGTKVIGVAIALPGQRSKKGESIVLHFDGRAYNLKAKNMDGTQKWVCNKRSTDGVKCLGFMYVIHEEGVYKVVSVREHNGHPKDSYKVFTTKVNFLC